MLKVYHISFLNTFNAILIIMQIIYGHISKMSTTEAFILPFKCIDMSVPGKAKDQKKKKKKIAAGM